MMSVEAIAPDAPVPESMLHAIPTEPPLVIEEDTEVDGKVTRVRLVNPLPHPENEDEALCRIKILNVPPSERCSLDDLRQFLNGAVSRLLDLDMYYRFPPGTSVPGPGEKVVPPPDTPEAPIKAIGNLNIFAGTCVVDVAFPLAGVALRNLQGVPCLGRPLMFERTAFTPKSDETENIEENKESVPDAKPEASVKKELAPSLTTGDAASIFLNPDEVPESLMKGSSHAGLVWLSGINPYSDDEAVKNVIMVKLAELQARVADAIHAQFQVEIEAIYLPKNRVTGRINGCGILKLKAIRKPAVPGEGTLRLGEKDAETLELYKESAFLVSAVRGLSRLFHGKVIDRFCWSAIPFLDYQMHCIEAFRVRARTFVQKPCDPKERLFDITCEKDEVEAIEKERSMTSKVFGDNLVEGLLIQRSRLLGMRPSRILQLTGIVFAEDLLSESTVQDLAKCIYSEFKKHAKIVQIVIPVPSLSAPLTDSKGEENEEVELRTPPGTGKVFVEVVELYGARKLQNVMNGVTFDLIRTCAVAFFPENLFMTKHLTTADEFYTTLNEGSDVTKKVDEGESSPTDDSQQVRCFIPAKKGKLSEVQWGTAGIHKVPGAEETLRPADENDDAGKDDKDEDKDDEE